MSAIASFGTTYYVDSSSPNLDFLSATIDDEIDDQE
jgi:hypothetical protein